MATKFPSRTVPNRGGFSGVIKKKKRPKWKHMCLPYHKQTRIPTMESDKDELFEAGLGEKIIEFDELEMSAEQFRDTLYDCFPRL